jgi:hypothetical protein
MNPVIKFMLIVQKIPPTLVLIVLIVVAVVITMVITGKEENKPSSKKNYHEVSKDCKLKPEEVLKCT